jgi:hypothetical protein
LVSNRKDGTLPLGKQQVSVEVDDMLGDDKAMWGRLRIERTACAALIPIDHNEMVFELAIEISGTVAAQPRPDLHAARATRARFYQRHASEGYIFVPSMVRCSKRLIETAALALNRKTMHPVRRAHNMSDSVLAVR